MKVFENYLLKDFKNHDTDLGPVLVDTFFLSHSLHLPLPEEPWSSGPGFDSNLDPIVFLLPSA